MDHPCTIHRRFTKHQCYFLTPDSVAHHLMLNQFEKKLLKRTIYNHQKHFHCHKQTKKDHLKIQKSIQTCFQMLANKLYDDKIDDARTIVYKLTIYKCNFGKYSWAGWTGDVRAIDPKMIAPEIWDIVWQFNFCQKMTDIELKVTKMIKELMSEFLESNDVRNLILCYSHPVFLPSDGLYETNTKLVVKNDFNVEKRKYKLKKPVKVV
jgi:hypothetical protein